MGVIRRYSNLTQPTALANAITGSATTIRVEGLPGAYPPAPFCLKVGDAEIVLVTAKTPLGSGQWDLTVERGYDGTSAVSHAIAEDVRHVAIADDFEGRWQDTIVKRPWGVYDDEFDDEEIDPAWTVVAGSGVSTYTEANGVLSWKGSGTTVNHVRSFLKNATGITPLVYCQTAVRLLHQNSNYLFAGPILAAGTTTTSTSVWASLELRQSSGVYVNLHTGTPSAMGAATRTYQLHPGMISGVVHLRSIWQAPNAFTFAVSPDGVSWTSFGAAAISVPFTPIYIGVAASTWGTSSVGIATFEYIRVGS